MIASLGALLLGNLALLVTPISVPQAAPDPAMMDFWVGTWDLTWTQQDGKEGKGENVISKILGGKIIHERFKELSGGATAFQGESWSGIDGTVKQWRQTWVDNGGTFMVFEALPEAEGRGFFRKFKTPSGETTQRMRFTDIKPESFVWFWESSTDGGKTWKLDWKINYKRRV